MTEDLRFQALLVDPEVTAAQITRDELWKEGEALAVEVEMMDRYKRLAMGGIREANDLIRRVDALRSDLAVRLQGNAGAAVWAEENAATLRRIAVKSALDTTASRYAEDAVFAREQPPHHWAVELQKEEQAVLENSLLNTQIGLNRIGVGATTAVEPSYIPLKQAKVLERAKEGGGNTLTFGDYPSGFSDSTLSQRLGAGAGGKESTWLADTITEGFDRELTVADLLVGADMGKSAVTADMHTKGWKEGVTQELLGATRIIPEMYGGSAIGTKAGEMPKLPTVTKGVGTAAAEGKSDLERYQDALAKTKVLPHGCQRHQRSGDFAELAKRGRNARQN